jgi:hypothetical protein
LQPGGAADPLPDAVADVEWRSPADVAAQVVDAIRSDRFWILTHPAYNEMIEARIHAVVETGELVEPVFL